MPGFKDAFRIDLKRWHHQNVPQASGNLQSCNPIPPAAPLGPTAMVDKKTHIASDFPGQGQQFLSRHLEAPEPIDSQKSRGRVAGSSPQPSGDRNPFGDLDVDAVGHPKLLSDQSNRLINQISGIPRHIRMITKNTNDPFCIPAQSDVITQINPLKKGFQAVVTVFAFAENFQKEI